jgi:hypothetical protein
MQQSAKAICGDPEVQILWFIDILNESTTQPSTNQLRNLFGINPAKWGSAWLAQKIYRREVVSCRATRLKHSPTLPGWRMAWAD